MIVSHKDGIVWMTDDDGTNRTDIKYNVDSDGDVDAVLIDGENIEYMDLSDDLYDDIYNAVAEAFNEIKFD